MCVGHRLVTYGQDADVGDAISVKYEYTGFWDSIPPVVYTKVDDNPKYPG